MNTIISARCAIIAIAAIAIAWCGSASAADYPNRPVQLVIPYAAGGATDTVGRLLQAGMEKRLGQPLLVINRPGASTILGTQSVAHAAPDGYTIGLVSVPHVANYTLMKEMPYAQSDFSPIATVTNTPNVLVVNPALPIKSLSELIAYIRARPGQINYGTFGIGSSAHLAALLFQSKIGTKITAVHYRGGAPAAVAVMSGEIQMAFGTPLSVVGGIEGGKLRPIAVTSEQRLNFLPNVPTMLESGLDYVNGAWFGILAPAGTPQPIIQQLYQAIKATMEQADVRKAIVDVGSEVFIMSPEKFSDFIAAQTKLWHGILTDLAVEKQ